MSHYNSAQDQFFHALVGTQRHRDALSDHLSTSVQVGHSDPYIGLGEALNVVIERNIPRHKDPNVSHSATQEDRDWHKILLNAKFGGKLIVSTLRAVEEIYVEHYEDTEIPQTAQNVRRNTLGVLHYMYGVAFSNKEKGMGNLAALRYGLDPEKPLALNCALEFVGQGLGENPIVNPDAFVWTADDDGQLQIQRRYALLRNEKGGDQSQCPGTKAKIATPEGTRSAMFTFVTAVGDVGVNNIFPRQFAIEQNTASVA